MASVDDLQKSLQEIKKILEQTAKATGTGGAAGQSGAGGKTLQDHFAGAFKQLSGKGGAGKMAGELAGKMGGSAGGMGGGMGGGMIASVLGFAAPLVGIGAAMAALPGIIRGFANNLHDANREFAKFSPSMAMVMAQSDMRDMMRKMEQGENMAGSAGNLANARGNLEDQLSPVDTAFGNFSNNLGAVITGAMATFLEESEWAQQLADMVEEASDALEDILEWLNLKKDKDQQDQWSDEIDRMARSEDTKHLERAQPVRKPATKDPRPNFPWDKGGGGDF